MATRSTSVFLALATLVFSTSCGGQSDRNDRAAVNTKLALSGVRCSLDVDDRDDKVVARVTCVNVSQADVSLLRYNLPADGKPTCSLFEIEYAGRSIPYCGLTAKRPAPVAADYLTLKPGESTMTQIAISAVYDLSALGEYSIRYRSMNPPPSSNSLGDVSSNTVHIIRPSAAGMAN